MQIGEGDAIERGQEKKALKIIYVAFEQPLTF